VEVKCLIRQQLYLNLIFLSKRGKEGKEIEDGKRLPARHGSAKPRQAGRQG